MKKTLKKGPPQMLTSVKRGILSEDLKHILSPLEQAALQHQYKPFVYNYEGISIYISRRSCKQFMDYATDKITFLTSLIELERLSVEIPIKHREAFYDPRLILALPPRLRNRLVKLGCYNMFFIMQKGKSYFQDEQGFSSITIQRLDALFSKYKCSHLFN